MRSMGYHILHRFHQRMTEAKFAAEKQVRYRITPLSAPSHFNQCFGSAYDANQDQDRINLHLKPDPYPGDKKSKPKNFSNIYSIKEMKNAKYVCNE